MNGGRTLGVARLFGLLAVILVSQACSSAARKDEKAKGAAKQGAESGNTLASPVEVVEASLRGKTYQETAGLKSVRFEYDQAALDEATRTTLKENAAWLKANPKVEIQVQGHCDERGTVEYNLALGQKRASAVRDYYRSIGVSMRRMSTISYGREQPVCHESNEECWLTNRRAETRARIK